MGSRHRALLGTTGGGEKLHELERSKYQDHLNDFLKSFGIGEQGRGTALAHFDIGYDDGYSGKSPYYSEHWDEPMDDESKGV